MNKMKITVVMTICTVLLLAACTVVYLKEDKTGPVIQFEEITLKYDKEDTEELLKGVTAEDAVDGPVNDSIRIENIIEFPEEQYCIVTYAAKDGNNNVSKAKRWIDMESGVTSNMPFEG